MKDESIIALLCRAVERYLSLPPGEVQSATDIERDLMLDSLDVMSLLSDIETLDKVRLEFSPTDTASISRGTTIEHTAARLRRTLP